MKRSSFRLARALTVTQVCAVLASCAGSGGAPAPESAPGTPPATSRVYVGTYTGGRSRGIYRFDLDTATGSASAPVLAVETENPSFLARHPGGHFLYAVNEVASFGGGRTGAVSAFAIEPVAGSLTLIDQQPSGGADPCHLVLDRAGRNVLVANYNGGNVAVFPVDADGSLKPAADVRAHTGSGPDAARQKEPHAHGVFLDAPERFAFAADLGADRVFVYRFDAEASRLVPADPASISLPPGSGPRHLAWHPSGKTLYVISELRSTVTVFRHVAGALTPVQTVSTLPPGFTGGNTAAEVAVSPDGRTLYASNRGDDSLAVFSIDAGSGRLTAAGRVPTGGRVPRHFAIDPAGRWLLAANQESDLITIFRIDAESGLPVRAGLPVVVGKPVCVLFAPPPP